MDIFLNILFLILGMVLLIKGADFFVASATAIAKKLKIPSIFIGLTIVSLGTSLPELSVSIASAISGSVDMSVGNIVGSNLFNMLLIIGLVSIFSSIPLAQTTKKIDFPFLNVMTGALLLFSLYKILNGDKLNVLSRTDSILLIILVSLYLTILILNANRDRKRKIRQEAYLNKFKEMDPNYIEQPKEKELKVWQIVVYFIFGLAAVVFGGECVSSTAQFLALKMGMSEALVGLTIVALGTSLPELVTSVVASRKGDNDLALGNVVGSNIMNIGVILGLVGAIGQAPVSSIIFTDMIILFVSTLIFTFVCARKNQIGRKEGTLFLCMYITFLAFAIIRNYCF